MKSIGLIIIGDEILSGRRQDKHFSKVLEILQQRGLALSWVQYLGDDRDRLTRLLKDSFNTDDLVFCCGGIGATPDDHTRQAAGAALNQPLKLHPIARDRITQRTIDMAEPGSEPVDMASPENLQRLKMGEFPANAQIIENPYNRIPGFKIGDHHFVPGFPVMAWPMIENVLDEHYSALHHQAVPTEISFFAVGLPESRITPSLEKIERDFDGIRVFCLPSSNADPALRHLELGVKGPADGVEAALTFLRQAVSELGGEIIPDPGSSVTSPD
ncbi:MAG: competence/damage-inducible protein A [Burkholderiaceae bacterium]